VSLDLHDVREAARLVAFALARTEPGEDAGYRDLISAYLGDGAFRALSDTVAEGLTVRPVACTARAGLVLAASASTDGDAEESVIGRTSPFAPLADDLRRAGVPASVRERQLWTLALLAVCYCAFPTPETLDDDSQVGQVDPHRAQQVLRDLCQQLDRQVHRQTDPPADEPQLERVWRAYLATAETGTTKDARALLTSADAIVARVCRAMHELRLLRPIPRVTPTTYRTTPRFQLHVREMAALPYWAELAVAAQRLTEETT
jgi:hypothetical protein